MKFNLLPYIFPPIFSFFITLLVLKFWIKVAKNIGLVGRDMHKEGKYVPEAGGISVILGIVYSLLILLGIEIYLTLQTENLVNMLLIITVLLLSGFLGFLDDILEWKKGLKPYQKVFFTLPIAFPIVAAKIGYTVLNLPFIGAVDFGVFYPLVLVPIGIIGAANGFNMIAGYNGLEASMGILLFIGLLLKFVSIRNYFLAYVSLLTILSMIAFLIYNKYPAKVFPGDSFTHSIGALYATLVIMGNIEKFGVILFSLYFVELLLFIRGIVNGVYKQNFGKLTKKGIVEPYEKVYSLTHLAIRIIRKIKGVCYEKDVTVFLFVLQSIILLLALWVC